MTSWTTRTTMMMGMGKRKIRKSGKEIAAGDIKIQSLPQLLWVKVLMKLSFRSPPVCACACTCAYTCTCCCACASACICKRVYWSPPTIHHWKDILAPPPVAPLLHHYCHFEF